jgi:hypothetical protein
MPGDNLPGGYVRLHAEHAGVGAAEFLWETVCCLRGNDEVAVSGQVCAVYDRTLYISLPTAARTTGPNLVALGTAALRDGPLVVHLDTPPGFSFRRFYRGSGATCNLHLRETAGPDRLQIQFERGGTVEVPLSVVPAWPAAGGHGARVSLRRFGPESPLVTVHRKLVHWLQNSDVEDGLGALDRLRTHRTQERDEVLAAFTSAAVELLLDVDRTSNRGVSSHPLAANECPVVPGNHPFRQLLGRGPGATPSGDDLLVGVLLVLLSIEETRVRSRTRCVATTVAEKARDETTAISAALLEQACYRRGAAPAIACLDRLLTGHRDSLDPVATAGSLLDVGHTSGVDTLVGMLLASTEILPVLLSRQSGGD